jgi:hypothetical protein
MEQKKVFCKQCGLFQLRMSGRSLPKSSKNAKTSKRNDENRSMPMSARYQAFAGQVDGDITKRQQLSEHYTGFRQ